MYPKDDYHEKVYSKISNKMTTLFTEQKHEHQFVKILQGVSFSKLLDNISKAICDDNKKYDDIKDEFNIKNEIVSPLNPNVKIKNVSIKNIKIKNSATRPLIIPCETSDNTNIKILYKRENVRKDQIIMNIMNLIDCILMKDEDYTSNMVLYNILPTGKTTGLIEVVNECETIYHVQEKLQKSILNYILDNNSDASIKDVRQKFIKSIATYCVVTYLLGVGDRHLDNIMVTKDGKLFHIDFGYVCGKDPVHSNPGIRITQDMIEAIGGINSPNYIVFTELCTKIYNCLRNYTEVFMNMLLMLPQISDLKMSDKEIIDLIIKRFIPGENIVDAKLHFVNQLEQQSYMDKIKDWCHYHSKEQTLNSAVSRLSSVVNNMIAKTN
jgi:phosphatidylinositol kinase/protein kinase (PI-3  family)